MAIESSDDGRLLVLNRVETRASKRKREALDRVETRASKRKPETALDRVETSASKRKPDAQDRVETSAASKRKPDAQDRVKTSASRRKPNAAIKWKPNAAIKWKPWKPEAQDRVKTSASRRKRETTLDRVEREAKAAAASSAGSANVRLKILRLIRRSSEKVVYVPRKMNPVKDFESHPFMSGYSTKAARYAINSYNKREDEMYGVNDVLTLHHFVYGTARYFYVTFDAVKHGTPDHPVTFEALIEAPSLRDYFSVCFVRPFNSGTRTYRESNFQPEVVHESFWSPVLDRVETRGSKWKLEPLNRVEKCESALDRVVREAEAAASSAGSVDVRLKILRSICRRSKNVVSVPRKMNPVKDFESDPLMRGWSSKAACLAINSYNNNKIEDVNYEVKDVLTVHQFYNEFGHAHYFYITFDAVNLGPHGCPVIFESVIVIVAGNLESIVMFKFVRPFKDGTRNYDNPDYKSEVLHLDFW